MDKSIILHHYKEIRFRAFVRHKEFGTTGSDLLRNFALRIFHISEETGLSRTSLNTSRLFSLLNQFQASVTHAFHEKSVIRMRPAGIIRTARYAVVATNAFVRIIANQTVFVVVISTEGTSLNAGERPNNADIEPADLQVFFLPSENANIRSKPVAARNRAIMHFGKVGLRTGHNTGSAADALCSIKRCANCFSFRP